MHKIIAAMVAAFVLYIGPVIAGDSMAQAQEVHKLIRRSLVYLKATGQVRSGQNASQVVDSYATGFLVSSDGLVLTTYHLIFELGDVVPQTVRIEAKISEKSANPWRAAIVDGSINTDLLLLKIPPSVNEYVKVSLGSALSHKDVDAIYTSGFPKSISYRKQDDKIEAREGPGGHLWTTGLNFKYGQSGSPIYDAAGKVIGVMKGDEDIPICYMIPIGFADSLMAQVRLREIQKALQDFESLRFTMDWDGKLKTMHGRSKIVVTYEKMVAGDPQVESIDLFIKPVGIRDGEKKIITDFKYGNHTRTSKLGKTGGVFEISGLWEKIEKLREELEFEKITHIKVGIVPILTDGTRQPSESIRITYEEED